MQYPKQLKDALGQKISQDITCMTFCKTIPPKYDCEIFNEDHQGNERKSADLHRLQSQKWKEGLDDRFLVFGLSKGTVIFLPVELDKIDFIYARVSVHRQAVTSIHEFKDKFISICEELSICIWDFRNYKLNVISYNCLYRPVIDIRYCNEILLLAFKSGDT